MQLTYMYFDLHALHVSGSSSNIIIESVDSIGRDGPDMYIYVICYKAAKISE